MFRAHFGAMRLAVVLALGFLSANVGRSEPIRVFVSRTDADKVERFDYPSGQFAGTFITGAPLDGPGGMAMGLNDRLLVTSRNNGRVLAYNGTTGQSLGIGPFFAGSMPTDIVVRPDNDVILVTDIVNDAVLAFRGDNYAFMTFFATGPNLVDPEAITLGPDNSAFVYSRGTGSILKYSTTGMFVSTFITGLGVGGGDMTWGPDGNLYVSDTANNRILRFRPNGSFMGTFATDAGLIKPDGLAFDPDGHLLVVVSANNTVRRYNGGTGQYMNTFGVGGPSGPGDILVCVPIPEPASLLLLVGGIAAILRRRS
jgi:DNA-binding beta-propeller fold protein YncE